VSSKFFGFSSPKVIDIKEVDFEQNKDGKQVIIDVTPTDHIVDRSEFKKTKVYNVEWILVLCSIFFFNYRPLCMFAMLNPDVRVLTYVKPRYPTNITDEENRCDLQHWRMWSHNELPDWTQAQGLDIVEAKNLSTTPKSYLTEDGRKYYYDYNSKHLNIVNGRRITTRQPPDASSRMFVLGSCGIWGHCGTDSGTIASQLQKLINDNTKKKICCENHAGYLNGVMETQWSELFGLPVRKGDYVVYGCFHHPTHLPLQGIDCIDLSKLFEQPHEYGAVFAFKNHYNDNGRKVLAEALFDHMQDLDYFSGGGGGVNHTTCRDDNHIQNNRIS
jgi:hypothetical protein